MEINSPWVDPRGLVSGEGVEDGQREAGPGTILPVGLPLRTLRGMSQR